MVWFGLYLDRTGGVCRCAGGVVGRVDVRGRIRWDVAIYQYMRVCLLDLDQMPDITTAEARSTGRGWCWIRTLLQRGVQV